VLDVSGELGLVSDYRFRGISLSGRGPAAQGSITVTHQSGLYGGFWASSIDETAGGAEIELDLVTGYSGELSQGLSIDALLTYYAYPSDPDINYGEVWVTFAYEIGALTPKAGVAYAPEQNNLRDALGNKRDNLYLFSGLDYAVESASVTLSTQIGHETGYLDVVEGGGKWDWQVGASIERRGLILGLTYAGSDAYVLDAGGRNIAGHSLVGSLRFKF
jgi:uncharacterized protein (TIGR02001 family)